MGIARVFVLVTSGLILIGRVDAAPSALEDPFRSDRLAPLRDRLAQARADLEAGAYRTAWEHLADLASHYPEMGDYVLYFEGRAARSMGEGEDADRCFRSLMERYSESTLRAAAVLERARLAWEAGNRQGTVRLCRVALQDDPSPAERGDALFLMAQALEAMGKKEAAAKRFHELHWFHPGHPSAGKAAEHLGRLGISIPTSPADHLARAEALADLGRHTDATDLLAEAERKFARDPALSRIRLERARLLARRRRYRDALRELDRLLQMKRLTPARKAEAHYEKARIWKLRQQPERALAETTRIIGAFSETPWCTEALLLQAQIHEEAGHFRRAEHDYARLLKRSARESTLRGRGLWGSAWMRYLSGDYRGAAQRFERGLATMKAHDPLRGRMRYWYARTLDRLGRKKAARLHYGALLGEGEGGYYGLLAWNRLQTEGGGDTAVRYGIFRNHEARSALLSGMERHFRDAYRRTYRTLSVPVRFHIDRIRELIHLGWQEERERETAFAEERSRDPQERQRVHYLLSLLWWRNGDFLASIQQANRIVRSRLSGFSPDEISRLLYPVAFWREIGEATAGCGVDPFLVLSIIRQESAFDPRAISRAGAVGLMQIMPKTAREIARKEGRKMRITQESLFSPRLNIELSCAHLRDLLDRHDNDLIRVLAAYNAGERTVRRWWAENASLASDEIAERIEYPETRAYVKTVLRNYFYYRRLFAEEHPPLIASAPGKPLKEGSQLPSLPPPEHSTLP
ncbi:MAG: hypothetical protein D6795_17735 [Deltaproteobacteria bacterium]|nr:MAG: hypothetical protein D6795_17735 [Deltaproteobacteria bacterium]